MRFYVSISRARRVALSIRTALRNSSSTIHPLGRVQASLARAYGYADWNELKLVSTMDARRSPWDEELSPHEVAERLSAQSAAFSHGLGIPPAAAEALARLVRPTASGGTSHLAGELPTGHAFGSVEVGDVIHHHATFPAGEHPRDARRMRVCILSVGPGDRVTGVQETMDATRLDRAMVISLATNGTEPHATRILSALTSTAKPEQRFHVLRNLANLGVDIGVAETWLRRFTVRLGETIPRDRITLLNLQEHPSPFERARRRMLGIPSYRGMVGDLSAAGARRLVEATLFIPGIAKEVARSQAAADAAERGASASDVVMAALHQVLGDIPDLPGEALVAGLAGCGDPRVKDVLSVAPALAEGSVPVMGSAGWGAFLEAAPLINRLSQLTERHPGDLFSETHGDWNGYRKVILDAAGMPAASPLEPVRLAATKLSRMAAAFERDVARPFLREAGIDTGPMLIKNQLWWQSTPYLFAAGGASGIIARHQAWALDETVTHPVWRGPVPEGILHDLGPEGDGDLDIDLGKFDQPGVSVPRKPEPGTTPPMIRMEVRELWGHDPHATLAKWAPFMDPAMQGHDPDRFWTMLVSHYRRRSAYLAGFAKLSA